ncbi:MAG: YHYH protein [Winogradskyella sp.]|nr:MAG: YHYH protein [Winogradskyella sp.]
MKYFLIALFLLLFISCNNQSEIHHHSHNDIRHSHTVIGESSQSYMGNYTLEDETYGTKTEVKIINSQRIMTTNSLPNHKTGDFPNQGNPNTISEQSKTYKFPLNPKYTGKATWAREPGVAINGVKFEPQTAEVVACDTGENYRVEALQDVIDLGLDFNHAHVQPTGAYHYHGVPTSVVKDLDEGEDLIHIGFAHDGFPMYYSKSDKYKPSYKALDGNREGEDCTYENPKQKLKIDVNGHHDGTYGSDFEYIDGYGDLDECNGITIDGKYMYLITNAFPYVSRCLMGEFVEQHGPQSQGNRPNGNPGGPPSYAELLEMMDDNKDGKISKKEVKGPLGQDFDKVDKNKDGFLTEDELKSPPRSNGQGRRPRRG